MLFTDFELSKVIQMINIEFKTQPTSQTIIQKYFCAKWLSVENLRFLSCRMPKLYILKGSDKFFQQIITWVNQWVRFCVSLTAHSCNLNSNGKRTAIYHFLSSMTLQHFQTKTSEMSYLDKC